MQSTFSAFSILFSLSNCTAFSLSSLILIPDSSYLSSPCSLPIPFYPVHYSLVYFPNALLRLVWKNKQQTNKQNCQQIYCSCTKHTHTSFETQALKLLSFLQWSRMGRSFEGLQLSTTATGIENNLLYLPPFLFHFFFFLLATVS